jgi:CAAX protease family protein
MSEQVVPDAVVPDVRPRWWGLGDFWITLALYLFFALIAGMVLLAVPDRPDPQAWAIVLSLALPWIGLAGWPLLSTSRKGLGPVRELRLTGRPRDLGLGVIAGLVGLVLASVVAVVLEFFTDSPLNSAVGDLAESMESASPGPLILLAVLSAFGAPVVEEIAFRGLMFGALEKRGTPQGWTIVLTAVVFALFHFEPVRLPVLLVIGLVLGWVRARTGSTLASMAAHMANNLPGAIALLALAFD